MLRYGSTRFFNILFPHLDRDPLGADSCKAWGCTQGARLLTCYVGPNAGLREVGGKG